MGLRAVLLPARLFDPSAGHLLAHCPSAACSLAPAPCRGRPHWPWPIRAATLLTFGEVRRVGRAIRTLRGDQVRAMARSLCFFGCSSSFLGFHGYGHLSPRVGLATSVFKPLNNCTAFSDTLFSDGFRLTVNCAGCTQARPSVVIPWLFGCLAGGDGVELCAYGFRGRGVDTGCSQQALGAAARLAHRRGQRGVEATEAAGEARSVRLSIPGTTRRSCPRRPMRCLPQSPEQPEVRVPMLLVAE